MIDRNHLCDLKDNHPFKYRLASDRNDLCDLKVLSPSDFEQNGHRNAADDANETGYDA